MRKNVPLQSGEEKKNILLIVCLLVTAIFIIAYFPFVAGKRYYTMSADSFNSYFPQIINALHLIKNFELLPLELTNASGVFSLVNTLFDPFVYLLLPFKEAQVPYLLIIITWAKYLLTAVFAFLFLKNHTRSNTALIIGSLLWTFNAYAVIYGQHYHFHTAVVAYTVYMYFIEEFIHDRKKALFIPVTAFIIVGRLSFFYAMGISSAVYIFFRMRMEDYSIKAVIKKEFELLVYGLICLLIIAPVFVPYVRLLFLTSNVGYSSADSGVFLSFVDYITALSKIFSVHMLGVSSQFSGRINYFKTYYLFSSVIFLFSYVYFFLRKKPRKWLLAVSFIIAAVLLFKSASFIVSLDINPRWTYIISFFMILLVVKYLDEMKNWDIRHAVITLALAVPLLVFLWVISKTTAVSIIHRYYFFAAASIIAFAVIILLSRLDKTKKYIRALVLLFAVFELLFAVILPATVNVNTAFTAKKNITNLYYSSTYQAIEKVKADDEAVFRINLENDLNYAQASISGVPTPDAYLPLESDEYLNFLDSFGARSYINAHNTSLSSKDLVLNALLGVKYIIASQNPYLDDYKLAGSVGSEMILMNEYALPFGYLYENGIDKDAFLNANIEQRRWLISEGFYFTNDEDYVMYDGAEIKIDNTKQSHVLPEADIEKSALVMSDDVIRVSDGFTIGKTAAESYIEIAPAEAPSSLILDMHLNISQSIYLDIYYADTVSAGYTDEKRIHVYVDSSKNGGYPTRIEMPDTRIRKFKIVFPEGVRIALSDLHLYNADMYFSTCRANLSNLQSTAMQNINYIGSTLSGDIYNPYEASTMLCIPLAYRADYSVKVNGVDSKLYNINGGLCGVIVQNGANHIVLEYKPKYGRLSIGLMGVGVLLLLMTWFIRSKQNRRITHK